MADTPDRNDTRDEKPRILATQTSSDCLFSMEATPPKTGQTKRFRALSGPYSLKDVVMRKMDLANWFELSSQHFVEGASCSRHTQHLGEYITR